MEKAKRKSFRLGIVVALIVVTMIAVFTLTACQNGAKVESLEVQEETNPGVMTLGSSFNDLGIKLTVYTEGEENGGEVYVTTSMLTAESREELKTVGEKHITVQYQGIQATFDILIVDAETETATVIFYDKDNAFLAKKTVVKGEAVTAPNPPEVSGVTFVEWVVMETSAPATNKLNALEEDLNVKAKYAENATTYTVTVVGPAGETRGTVQVRHGEKISLSGVDTSLSSDYDASTLRWTPDISTYVVTNNVTVRMDAQKKEKTVEYCYAFASKPEVTYSLGLIENVVIGKTVTKQSEARTLITRKGLDFVEWQNTSTTINSDTKFVAIVADRTFTVSFKNGEHSPESVLAGTRYTLPNTAPTKAGYNFVLAWQAGNTVYRISETPSIVINSDIVLEAVYSPKNAFVKLVYNFDLKDGASGQDITENVTLQTTKYGDKIDFAFISAELEKLKRNNALYTGFEIEKIVYDEEDVTAKGVTLGEMVGTTPHEFTVAVANAARGTSDLTIVNGVVQAYTGSKTTIYIPESADEKAVTEIAADAFAGKTIVRIVIPDTVKKIGAGAFAGATFGSDVALPALTTLGEGVFAGAKTIRVSALDEDPVYQEISVTFASGEGTFTTLPANTFAGSENIVSVVLPAVTAIGDEAFYQSDVATVTGLAAVESVGVNSFAETFITALELPKVKSVGAGSFASMANLVTLSIATETVYEGTEETLNFAFTAIDSCGKLETLTLGKGVTGITASDAGLASLKQLNATDNVTAITDSEYLATLDALTAINVTAVKESGAVFASDGGVLYAIAAQEATLAVYPIAKGGDYTVPAKVGGVDVTAIESDFAQCRINTLTVNDAVVNAIIATDPVAHIRTDAVANVIIKGSLLGEGETLVANVNKLVTYFFYAKNIVVDGGSLTAEVIEANAWTNVLLKAATTLSIYNSTYGLTYEKVTVNNVTTAKILFGNTAAKNVVIPATIDGITVTDIADGAFAGNTRLTDLTIQAALKSFGSGVLTGAVNLSSITVTEWGDKATIAADAFDDTAWAKGRNLLVLGGRMIKYNNFAADEEKGISTDLVASDFIGVSEIPDAFFKNMNNLTSVVLPASVVTIGTEAFSGSGIESIDLGAVLNIKERAFAGAEALQSIVLSTVAEMGKYVFADCVGLRSVIVTATANRGYLPVGTFSGCTSLTGVTFGENALVGLAQDEDGKSEAFKDCVALTDISFLSGVTYIPAYAFAGCTALKAVDFTKNAVTTIGENAFADCTGLESITISARVVDLGENAFAGCTGLKAVRFVSTGGILAAAHEVIDYPVFPTTGGYVVYVPGNAVTTNIAQYDARIERTLPKVSFAMYVGYAASGSLGMIDQESIYMDTAPEAPAFDGYVFDAWYVKISESYKKVNFPYSVEENVTFYARYFNLEKGSIVEADLLLDAETDTYALVAYANATDDAAYIPATYLGKAITVVYAGAFAACENLAELTLPSGVVTIKKGTPGDASAKPTHLKKLYIPATVVEIEDGAFADLSDLDIDFEESSILEKASKAAFVGTAWYLDKKDVAENGGNNGFIIAGRLAIEYCGESKTVECPSDLYKLAEALFKNNTDVEEIVINNALTYIGDECFAGATNLAYVSYLDASAASEVDGGNRNSALVYATAASFAGTKWLNAKNKAIIGTILLKYNGLEGDEIVSVPDYVTAINAGAFRGDGTVKEVRFGTASKLVKIGDYAFAENKLTTVTLPAVQEMGENVFAGCLSLRTADLTKVVFDTLPQGTFAGDVALRTLTLSAAVKALDNGSLTGCTALENITAPGLSETDTLEDSGLFGTAYYNVAEKEEAQYLVLGKVLVKYVAGTEVGEEEIVASVPDGVEVIYAGVFASSSVNVVNLPASVKVIEQNAFMNAASLRQVNFVSTGAPFALAEIGDMAFSGASALTDFVLPEKLKRIGRQAFAGTALTSVEIPASTTVIEYRAFYGSRLATVVIGSGVTFIGEEAFGHCADLYKVVMNLDAAGLDRLNDGIESYLAEEIGSGYDAETDFVAHVSSIFRKEIVTKARVYAENALFNYIVNTVDDVRVTSWRNDSAEVYANGDYPQVSFDNTGYYEAAFKTEEIVELGVPAKTGNTFVGWYLDNTFETPVELPYSVHSDTRIYAKWFVNALADAEASTELTFGTAEDGYVVSGVKAGVTGTLYIPSTVGGLPVVGISMAANTRIANITKIVLTNASAFDGGTTNMLRYFPDLKEVELFSDDSEEADAVVVDGVMYSGDMTVLIAYLATEDENGQAATEFVVPAFVTEILPYAFVNSGLTKITLSEGVQTIGENAFNDELEEIVFANNIQLVNADSRSFDNTVWYKGKDGSVPAARTDYVVNGSTVGFFYSAGNMLLRYKQEAQTVELRIPDHLKGFDVTVIASYIYVEVRGETPVSDIAFDRMVLPGQLRKINSNAFVQINVRVNITATSTVLNDIADDVFGEMTFYRNNNSDSIVLGNVLIKWISTANTIVVPEGIVAISREAFYGSQVTTLTLPSTLKHIGDYAFYNCNNLRTVSVPNGVLTIGEQAFANCRQLTNVTFDVAKSTLTEIGDNAFENCPNLLSVALPYKLETLGDRAFNNCIRLTTVTFDYITQETGADNVIVTTVKEKSKMTYLGESAFANCKALTTITIPNGLTAIKAETFNNCSELKSVVFDVDLSKVTVIEHEAFAGCAKLGGEIDLENPSLVTVVLPNSLVRIQESAFKDCESMYGIRINYNVRYVEDNVFLGCKQLTKIDVYSLTPASITTSSFNRGSGVVYKLRIYVGNSPSGNVKATYKRDWSTYAANIYERNDVPVLYYTTTDAGNLYTSDAVETDVVVSPSWTYKGTNYTTWTFSEFAYYGEGNTLTVDNSALRLNENVSSGTHAVVQNGSYVIIILDYDVVKLKTTI